MNKRTFLATLIGAIATDRILETLQSPPSSTVAHPTASIEFFSGKWVHINPENWKTVKSGYWFFDLIEHPLGDHFQELLRQTAHGNPESFDLPG